MIIPATKKSTGFTVSNRPVFKKTSSKFRIKHFFLRPDFRNYIPKIGVKIFALHSYPDHYFLQALPYL